MKNKFIEMKQKDIKPLKEKIWLQNNKKCPLLDIEVSLDKIALDHVHKLKDDEYSENKGVIRNSIEFRANAIEGKITNNWKRYFGSDESAHPISLPNFLRNLADYLENPAYTDENGSYYVHPTEVKKPKKLMKSSYNKLKKLYNKKAKFPDYPRSGKITKKLDALFKFYDLEPEFYS